MGVVVGPADCPVELAGLQKRIYEIVRRSHPNRISTEDIACIIYADREDGGPDWANSVIRRLVWEINKKLTPHNLKISGRVGRASPGYCMVEIESPWDAMWKRPFDRPELVYGES